MALARTFVIGDIHGCITELNRLLDALAPALSDTLVFLGDYIDRGPAPKAVVERLLRLSHSGPRCVFLKGNHEDMFLSFLGEGGRHGDAFLGNGGAATLRSYGLEASIGMIRGEHLPPDHLQFFRTLTLQHRHERFLCVHAGLDPTRALEDQHEDDLLWIRGAFCDREHPFPVTVLYGHTPYRDVYVDLPYKIGLDTGCVYGNMLSCLELTLKTLFQIQRGEGRVRQRSLRQAFHDPAPASTPTRVRDA
jgi:serine/threonine protein phosphatase 1